MKQIPYIPKHADKKATETSPIVELAKLSTFNPLDKENQQNEMANGMKNMIANLLNGK